MEVPRRYVEQLQTTVETMRRRGIATYDLMLKLSARSVKLMERMREVGEPVAYDVRDQLVTACSEQEPLDAQDRETRNNLVELYLGISVLLIGLSAGELSGSLVLSPIISYLFDPWVEFSLFLLSPIYVVLSFRKNAALDETERRVWLFGLSLIQGAFISHLIGSRLIRTIPAIFFLQPLVFALLTDYELSPASLYSDRSRLLGTAAALGGGLSVVAASFPLGAISMAIIVISLLHIGVLFTHFQVVISTLKNKTYSASEAQLGYVMSLLVSQILVAALFVGSDKVDTFNKHH